MSGKGRSKLQKLAQKRNSAKGRIKGLRNNLRGLLKANNKLEFLTLEEENYLQSALVKIEEAYKDWNNKWEQIKGDL